MAVIEIIAKSKGKTIVPDDTNNKKDANQQVDFWQNLKGKGWKVFTKTR